jgi:hypothetical protein
MRSSRNNSHQGRVGNQPECMVELLVPSAAKKRHLFALSEDEAGVGLECGKCWRDGIEEAARTERVSGANV